MIALHQTINTLDAGWPTLSAHGRAVEVVGAEEGNGVHAALSVVYIHMYIYIYIYVIRGRIIIRIVTLIITIITVIITDNTNDNHADNNANNNDTNSAQEGDGAHAALSIML